MEMEAPAMRDRTAMTEPLTIGQQLVARWESVSSGWSEPADLAEAIDAAIAAEREACAKIIEDNQEGFSSGFAGSGFHLSPRLHGNETGLSFARAIRARSL